MANSCYLPIPIKPTKQALSCTCLIVLIVYILGWRRVHFLRWVRVSRLGWVGSHLIGRWLSLLDSPSSQVGILLGTLLLGTCCDNSSGGRNRSCGSCTSGLSTSRHYTIATANDNADDGGEDYKESWKRWSYSSPNSNGWRGYKVEFQDYWRLCAEAVTEAAILWFYEIMGHWMSIVYSWVFVWKLKAVKLGSIWMLAKLEIGNWKWECERVAKLALECTESTLKVNRAVYSWKYHYDTL